MAGSKLPDIRRHLPSTIFVIIFALIVAGFVGAFVFAGVYNIGADKPHWKPVHMALEQLRDRAIRHHASDIVPPADLKDPKRVAVGAGLYTEMCSGCHLGPGLEKSEISQGLYPPAPELARGTNHPPAEKFWIIKHGVKLSAMPAWGRTHDDQLIWDMVAFLEKLPKMTPEQYAAAIASAPEDHDAMMKDMPGMMKNAGESKAAHAHAPGETDQHPH